MMNGIGLSLISVCVILLPQLGKAYSGHPDAYDVMEACVVPVKCLDKPVSNDMKYFYNATLNRCIQFASRCAVDNSTVFSDITTCLASCIPNREEAVSCKNTVQGCCSDGSPKSMEGLCTTEEQARSGSDSKSSFSHWQLGTVGVCSIIIAMGIVSLVFAVAYVNRGHRRNKQRRYISHVLKMYEETPNGDSDDSSFDDNPDTKNLFERL